MLSAILGLACAACRGMAVRRNDTQHSWSARFLDRAVWCSRGIWASCDWLRIPADLLAIGRGAEKKENMPLSLVACDRRTSFDDRCVEGSSPRPFSVFLCCCLIARVLLRVRERKGIRGGGVAPHLTLAPSPAAILCEWWGVNMCIFLGPCGGTRALCRIVFACCFSPSVFPTSAPGVFLPPPSLPFPLCSVDRLVDGSLSITCLHVGACASRVLSICSFPLWL